jgi:hypothetical protein
VETALVIVGSLMIVATLLPLARDGAWWIRVFDFPRAQIVIVSAAVLALYVLLTPEWGAARIAFAATLAACLAWQSYMMFPYLPLAPKQVQDARRAARPTATPSGCARSSAAPTRT